MFGRFPVPAVEGLAAGEAAVAATRTVTNRARVRLRLPVNSIFMSSNLPEARVAPERQRWVESYRSPKAVRERQGKGVPGLVKAKRAMETAGVCWLSRRDKM